MEPLTQCRSCDFTWDTTREEFAKDDYFQYDIRLAKTLIKATPREVFQLPIIQFRPILAYKIARHRFRSAAHPLCVDLAHPLIFAVQTDGQVLIDGRHRIRTALAGRIEHLNCVFLTADESARVCVAAN